MKGRWIMGLGGLAVLLLIVVGTAIGVAAAARSGPSPVERGREAALKESTAAGQTQQPALQEVEGPWLGIMVVQTPDGVAVGAVIADSPADGLLQRGDIIKSVDGVAIANVRELRDQLIGKAVGATINLTIVRGGQEQSVSVTLGQRPEPLVQRPKPFPELEGLAEGELFSHILSGQLNLTDAAGNPLTVKIHLGTVAGKTDNSLTVTLNDGSGNKTYQVTENTLGRQLLSGLEEGAKVTVVTAGDSSEARIMAPGRGLGHLLPGLGKHDGYRHFRMPGGHMRFSERSLAPASGGLTQ